MKDHASDLYWFLASHRFFFTLLYILVLLAFVLLVAFFGITPIIELLVGFFKLIAGHEEPFIMFFEEAEKNYLDSDFGPYGLYFFIPYFLAQFFFVWGIGKIYIAKPSGGKIKIWVALFFISMGLCLVTMGILLPGMDFIDFDGKLEKTLNKQFDGDTVLFLILGSGWLFWGIIGWRLHKADATGRGPIRFFEMLLRGSWIQFVIVLPLYIGIQQKDDCPCFTASYFSLMLGIPLLLFLIGPGLYLLYLKEKTLADRNPSRPRKILSTKSRWV